MKITLPILGKHVRNRETNNIAKRWYNVTRFVFSLDDRVIFEIQNTEYSVHRDFNVMQQLGHTRNFAYKSDISALSGHGRFLFLNELFAKDIFIF